jgi:hypothetical protein
MKLRPYQQEIAKAVMDSIQNRKGLTFSVEIARQGGKNELSAHLEVLLLTLYMARGGNLIKCSPTFKPQTTISMQRLKDRLDEFGFDGIYGTQMGYIIQLGNARAVFLSAQESSSVVGHTADILLEIDESQDVSKEKYTKEFRPMGSATNVTTIHYGTTWDDNTLLEEVKQTNLELEKMDGVRRHFRFDWQEVGKSNLEYLRFVEAERERLGENHPLFRTQYALLPISGGGGFLSRQQIALLQGTHQRLSQPGGRRTYIAGIDLAGEPDMSLRAKRSNLIVSRDCGACSEHERGILPSLLRPCLATANAPHNDRGQRAHNDGEREHDSTVITIAEVDTRDNGLGAMPDSSLITHQPSRIKVVEHYRWIGTPHSQVYPQMLNILKNVWNCRRIVIDATGMGQPVASFLRKELGSKVIPFTFTSKSKSQMGFELLSSINSGRLKLYKQDGSPEYQELMSELHRAKVQYRPNQTMNFYVDPQEGHDDFLMSLALVAQAGKDFNPREAKGWLRES